MADQRCDAGLVVVEVPIGKVSVRHEGLCILPKKFNYHTAPSAADTKRIVDFYAQGKFNSAEHVARQLTARFPRHPYAWKVLGVLLDKSGNLDLALICKRKAAALAPDDADAHHNLGNAWMKKGRFPEAEASFRRVIALRPRFSEAHRTLANALKMQGLASAAEASYRHALAIDPADVASMSASVSLLQCNIDRTMHWNTFVLP